MNPIYDCLPAIQACAMRVARLDSNGVPHPGANSLYVSNKLVTATFTPEYKEGTEFQTTSACGESILDFRDDPRLRWWNVELALGVEDPPLTELISGGTVLNDVPTGAVGWASPALLSAPNPFGFSLELWSRRVDENGDQDDVFPYLWWALPKVKNLRVGARNLENAPMTYPFTGGRAIQNPNWFNGPGNDWPVASNRAIQSIPTDDIPSPHCGYQSLPAS